MPRKKTEAHDALLTAVEQLPPRARRVFILNRVKGLSYREIAELLQDSESNVEKYMVDALKRLRSALSEPGRKE